MKPSLASKWPSYKYINLNQMICHQITFLSIPCLLNIAFKSPPLWTTATVCLAVPAGTGGSRSWCRSTGWCCWPCWSSLSLPGGRRARAGGRHPSSPPQQCLVGRDRYRVSVILWFVAGEHLIDTNLLLSLPSTLLLLTTEAQYSSYISLCATASRFNPRAKALHTLKCK